MKKQDKIKQEFQEKLDDACNAHMNKEVSYIKSRFSFIDGYMYRHTEINKLEEEISTLTKVTTEHINEQDKLIFELTEENNNYKNNISISEHDKLYEFAKYLMPKQYTELALKRIVSDYLKKD